MGSRLIIKLAIGGLAIGVVLWLGRFAEDSTFIREMASQYGYVGVFVVAVIAGFNLAIPVPAASFIPLFVASGLGFWLVISTLSVGQMCADFFTYFLGRIGRNTLTESGQYTFLRLEKMRDYNYWAPVGALFLFAAFVPFPNEVITFPLGFLGYKARHVAVALVLGSMVFNTLAGFGFISLAA